MRAIATTDDYLTIDEKRWTVVDTSPGKCAFCGVCTGMAAYGPSWWEDHISFESYLKLDNDMLVIDDSWQTRRYQPDWLGKYDRFVAGRDIGKEVPYTGWMLVYEDSRYAEKLIDLLFASGAMELRFDEGRLVETIDLETVLIELGETYPHDNLLLRLYGDSKERVKAVSLISALLKGDYNSTVREDHAIAKKLKWGYRDGIGSYECATCSKLKEHGVLPLMPPKRPRKKKYRHIEQQIPHSYPQWVRDLAEQQSLE